MRMWLACLVLLCAVSRIDCIECDPECVPAQGDCNADTGLCDCHPGFTGEDCSVTDVSILSISRQPATNTPADKLLKICTNTELSDPNYILGIGSKEGNDDHHIEKTFQEYRDETLDNPKCKIFKGDITGFTEKPIFFLFQGTDTSHHPSAHGEATFSNLPADFIEDDDITKSQYVGAWTSSGKVLTADSLRLELNKELSTWKLCVDGVINSNILCATAATGNQICYAIEVGDTTKQYSLCIMNDDSSVVLNTAILLPDSISAEDEAPESVLLAYGSTPKMTIKTISDDATLEFVPYKGGGATAIHAVCLIGDTPCDLTYAKSNDEMKILIVDNAGAGKSNTIPFKDYNIEGTNLGADIIEVYWKRGTEHFYGAAIDPPVSIDNVVIDCTEDDIDNALQTYCYAYFIGLTPDTAYSVTVTPAGQDDPEDLQPKLTNQITADPITPHASSRKQIMGITLLKSPSHADGVLQVCYNTPESNHNNTRNEAILIDENGHWMKMYHYTQVKDLMHCFSSVNLLTSSLSITKDTKLTVVIVERELTGYQVLSSGQADIDLSGLRVIKPDEDNRSDGSTSTLTIVGAAIGGVACLMALVAAAILFVMKRKKNNDGLQYPLDRTNVEDVNVIHGLDNPNST